MALKLVNLPHNPTGWGPTKVAEDVPTRPYSKAERFGRPLEFWGGGAQRQNPYWQPRQPTGDSAFGKAAEFDEEVGFTFVDASKPNAQQKKMNNFRHTRLNNQQQKRQPAQKNWSKATKGPTMNKLAKGRAKDQAQNRRLWIHRQASLEVRPTWKVVHQFPLPDLQKLSGVNPPEPQDLKVAGNLEYYDPKFDKLDPKKPPKMEAFENKSFFSPPTMDDPIIQELSYSVIEQAEKEPEKMAGKTFAFGTDRLMSTLMTSIRSVNSWDIILQVVEVGKTRVVFFDKREREGGVTYDLECINETARQPPTGEKAANLSEESLIVNQQITQQILKRGGKQAPKTWKPKGACPNPFAGDSEEDPASTLYKYRQWNITPDMSFVARCQLDGCSNGGKETYRAYSLLEYDNQTDWRKKLLVSPGAVLATEIKNNNCLLAKWTMQSLLVGASAMKIGYSSRVTHSNREDHQLLSCPTYDPAAFARHNLALNIPLTWAVLRHITETASKLPEGKYALLKDPHKPVVYIYEMPEEAEEEEEDEPEEGGEN